MRLTVVGCSGSYPGPDSAASCYLLEAEEAGRVWRILLDLGSGALGDLHKYADPLAIDAVLLSHLHPDHCMDLCGFYVMRKYHPAGRQPRIPVWGPPGTAERMARAHDLPSDPGMHEEFEFEAYAGPFNVGPFAIVPVRVDHPGDAFGLRVTVAGVTIGYSGDTGPCDGLDRVAAGVQIFLAEASFLSDHDNRPHLHLTGTQCGDAASRALVERLVLTHVPPWFDKEHALAEARAVFSGPIELAKPGATYDL